MAQGESRSSHDLRGEQEIPGTAGAPSLESAQSAQPSQIAAHEAARRTLHDQLEPWHKAVADPSRAQETVLRRILHDYAKTGYGASHGASAVVETEADDAREPPGWRGRTPKSSPRAGRPP